QEVVKQQFDIGKQIISYGLVPIIEPEVDIHSPEKTQIEDILHEEIEKELAALEEDQYVMIKLSIPTNDNLYKDFIKHPNVIHEANKKLKQNDGLIASFSIALSQDLNVNQSDEKFNKTLKQAVKSIYDASI